MRRSAIPIATILPFLLTILVAACGSHKSGDGNDTVCDWDSIKARGELRVLTLYSSTSYFFYKGEERGYEYELIKRFADDNGLAVWDMYHILGGRRRACLNWQEAGLMRPDHIHYLAPAYELQGQLFYQALIKAYNDYVEY